MSVNNAALTTLANLKTALNISASDKDTFLEQIIDSTTFWIEGRANRKLKARNYNGIGQTAFSTTSIPSEDCLYFDGNHHQHDSRIRGILYLPVPVIRPSVSGALPVELAVLTGRTNGADGAGDTWDATQLLEGRDYVVDYDGGLITLVAGVFATGYKNYRVKCTGGYFNAAAQPYVPADLERLCIELAKQMFRESSRISSERIGTWSRTYTPVNDDPFLRDILGKYTRFAF